MNLVTSNTSKLIDILAFILALSSYDIAKLQESNLLHTSLVINTQTSAKSQILPLYLTCTTCALWLNPIRWVIMRVVLYNGIPCVEFHIAVIQVHVITYWFRKRPVSNRSLLAKHSPIIKIHIWCNSFLPFSAKWTRFMRNLLYFSTISFKGKYKIITSGSYYSKQKNNNKKYSN